MFIYRNALKNLSRNKGRNILVSVILLIVMAAATVSLAVRSASEAMITDYRDSFGVETRIAADWENAGDYTKTVTETHDDGSQSTQTTTQLPLIPLESFLEYGESEYVQDALFAAVANFVSDSLEAVPLADNLRRVDGMTVEELMEIYGKETLEELYNVWSEEQIADITSSKRDIIGSIWGYSDVYLMRGFAEGRQKIIEGRAFEEPGEVLAGEQFAELNGLSPGDMIYISGGKLTDTAVMPLTVVGIYTDYQASLNSTNIWIGLELSDIIVSFDTLTSLGFGGVIPLMEDILYSLNDIDAVEPFLQALREKGLPVCYKTISDVESYNSIVEPVENMSSVATAFGSVIFLTGAVILVFLSIINIRERKYEVGVLRAIGMKKHQLARGLVYESLSLVLLCTVLGLTAGSILATPVSEMLLNASEIVHEGVKLNPAILPLLLLIALGLGVISSLIGVLYITKYEPIKILSEQN